ncbi:sulfate transporter [Acetobacter aceti 1023]|nr:sulfate transporter [Acetobacter aceti 1023]
MTMQTVPDGFMQDSRGRLVPEANVRPSDKLQDELVRRLHHEAEPVRQFMMDFKRLCFTEIHAFLDLVAEQYSTKLGSDKGNVTLTSYDGTLRVTVAVGNVISFGPEIQAAQTLIHSCLNRWSEGANANLKAVVLDAFDVDKQGSMNVGKILALRRLEIDDEEWQRGMQAISDSVRVDVTKDYVRLHRRPSPDAKWELVTFDLSKLDVATT